MKRGFVVAVLALGLVAGACSTASESTAPATEVALAPESDASTTAVTSPVTLAVLDVLAGRAGAWIATS